MVEFNGRSISGRIDKGTVEGMTFNRCTFDNCSLGSGAGPNDRAIVRNVVLNQVTQRACFIRGAAVEDVQLHELNRLGGIPLFFSAAVFKHVTITGKTSGMKINRQRDPLGRGQDVWDAANKQYYRTVDWALDISKAEFQGSISLEAVPGSLIKRDEETQVLVKRDRLESVDWRSLDFGRSAYNVCLDWFLTGSQFDDVVLVAEKRSRTFKDSLAILGMLRREGIAT
jgi:hypothetical protein